MGKTIFIGARKGGVGKTMTAASLGVGLARDPNGKVAAAYAALTREVILDAA